MPKINSPQNTIEHVWSVLCTSSSIDSESKNLTLFNVIEEVSAVRAKGAPQIDPKVGDSIPIQMELVTLWKKNPLSNLTSVKVKTDLIDPQGNELGSHLVDVAINDSMKRIRTRLKINGIKITTSGNYVWRISIKDEKTEKNIASIPLEISLSQQ